MIRSEPGRRPMMLTVVRPSRLDLDAFARAAGAHPEAVRGLVTLGAIDAERDASGALWFSPAQVAAVARIQRLRAGLSLNYAAIGLVIELLDRIAVLETALRKRPVHQHHERWEGRTWT
jgi:chaperone modulatory protein CbpM